MAAKKYQVFVSSTFRDLVEERQDTIRNILDLNHIPAGMELFPAADVEQLSYIKKVIDECDYYLLIIGGRYGSLDAEGVGFTEREYDYAVESGKFVIAFVHGEPETIAVKNSEHKPDLIEALASFREKVMNGRLVRQWCGRQDLQLVVLKSLIHAFDAYPQIGWIRGNAAASDQLLEQSNKALQENAQLRETIASIRSSLEPDFQDIASLDDVIEIRYRYRYKPSQYSSDYLYTGRTHVLKWKVIFKHLASELSTSKSNVVISNATKSALIESNSEYKPFDINDMDLATIKAQFLAHKLIDARPSKATNGQVYEFITLTDLGRRLYMESIVIRKGQ